MAVVEYWEWWRRVANNRKGERLEKWERRHNLPETPSGLSVRPDGTVSVSLHGCVFRRGFTPDGHDMHIQTRVRRPPTLDTGKTPGPDTWSVVRRQVRQETDWCLLATCQSRLTLTLFSQLPPYPVESTNHLQCFRSTQIFWDLCLWQQSPEFNDKYLEKHSMFLTEMIKSSSSTNYPATLTVTSCLELIFLD